MRNVILDNFKRKSEAIRDEDLAVLKKIGIPHYPFFKFTEGGNSIVVYAYEEKHRKLVVKLKEVRPKGTTHTLFDTKIAKKLAQEGFDVVEFLGVNVAPPGTAYRGKAVTHYEITKWIGYDFDIRMESAIYALAQESFNEEARLGAAAIELLKEDMLEVGELVGRLFKHHILYADIKPRNLARNGGRIVLFDIDPGYFKRSSTKEKHGDEAGKHLEFVKHKVLVYKASHLWGFLLQYFYAGLDRVEGTGKLKKYIMDKHPLTKGFRQIRA